MLSQKGLKYKTPEKSGVNIKELYIFINADDYAS